MEAVKRVLARVDAWQRAHRVPGFLYAVQKKFGEDDAAYQSALLTYYGFLSLFPLLLVATSVLQLVLAGDPALQRQVLDNITSYIPAIGSQLNEAVNDTGRSGLALVVGTIFTLYGARGVADALQYTLNHSWHVPRPARPTFPAAPLKSLAVILVGGLGLLAAVSLGAVAANLNRSAWFAVVPILVSTIVLFGTFLFILNLSIAKKLSWKQLLPGAILAAVGIQAVQVFGNLLIAGQLRSFNSLYGTFALVLGLLAGIFLQARVLMYAVTVNTVWFYGLWPRSLTGDELTEQDRRAFRLYAKKERFTKTEKVSVHFKPPAGV